MNAARQTEERYDNFKNSLSAAVDDSAEAMKRDFLGFCQGIMPINVEQLTHTPIQV